MISVKLPDGTVKEFQDGARPREVVESIGKRLAEASIAAVVDGAIVDLDRPITPRADASPVDFRVLTPRDREALDVLRHSTAHVMARAIMRLFPGVQLAFGPTTAAGFYYDVALPGNKSFSEDDFAAIEAEMTKLVALAEPFERFSLPVAEARQFCGDLGQGFKVEHIDEELSDPKYGGVLSFYRQGEFVDLCRGPHIPNAGKVGAFKLLSIAGAYWKGRADGPSLQRVYGTAFFDKKEMDAHLSALEEAKKRDHRKLGKELGLFTISQMVGSGLILWMPKGAIVRGVLEAFLKDELLRRGYQPVYTPHIGKVDLYITSGHYPYYSESQYPPFRSHPLSPIVDGFQNLINLYMQSYSEAPLTIRNSVIGELEKLTQGLLAAAEPHSDFPADAISKLVLNARLEPTDEELNSKEDHRLSPWLDVRRICTEWLSHEDQYLLKPMNCPHHTQIYAAQPRSYRDLPVRLAEFGTVYRYEQSGELSGLTRVRGFTQDDAHLFCTPDQVRKEFRDTMELTQHVLSSLGLADYKVRLSKSDPDDPKYQGAAGDIWRRAEEDIRSVLDEMKLNYEEAPGEAAFYGPKADFIVRDCLGRQWQLGTVQLDYVLPERFKLTYTGEDNKPHTPVMIHRAPFGSMERFMGILIEHFAGAFPLWLAPEQVRVLPISDKVMEIRNNKDPNRNTYVEEVLEQLRAAGLRVEVDTRPEKIGAKIRDAQLAKVPVMLVVGAKEAESEAVAYRDRVDGDLGAMPLAEAVAKLRAENDTRAIRQTVEPLAPPVPETSGDEQHAY